MTRVQLLSDVHCEFLREDGTKAFIASLDPTGVDVLVLAGDIGNSRTIGKNLVAFCERYRDAKVAFVHGNHELYGAGPEIVMDLLQLIASKTPNLRVLNDTVIEVGGITIAGTPLWFRQTPRVIINEAFFNDFRHIQGLHQWVYKRNKASEAFLREILTRQPIDVVVTHHLPSATCIAEKYRGSSLNDFFCAPIADELDTLPRAWMFGHTHDAADFEHRGCRFVCNPYGYPEEPKAKFRKNLIIELEPLRRS